MMEYKDLSYKSFFLYLGVAVMISVAAHEASHLLAAGIFGISTEHGYGLTSVAIDGGSPVSRAVIGACGPLANLILFAAASFMHRRNSHGFWAVLKHVNLLMFLINILPVPGLDGWHFLKNLLRASA